MIRKSTTKDLGQIIAIIRLNSDTFSKYEIPSATKNIKVFVKNQDKHNRFYVIEADKIVGCGGFSKCDDTKGVYDLYWLAIHPDFKRQGLATKLYKIIENEVKSLGGRMIILNAGSKEVNKYFYKKMGFRVCGKIPKYYSKSEDLIWYYKAL